MVTVPVEKVPALKRSRAETGASLGRLEVILLSLLSTSARTGYDVRKWLDLHGPYVGYSAQTSQIYRQLGKIVDRGWATPVPDPRDSGPDAKLYEITNEGRRKLQEWIDSPYEPPMRPLDPDFQVRLKFAGSQSPEKALELVRAELSFRREHRQNHLIVIALAEEDFAPDEDEDDRYWREELVRLQSERGLYMVNSLMAWLEATEVRLEAMIRQRDLTRKQ
ncbi:PadR family transcriptional regulator [Pseudarthrobacter niigatensis]|uniref:DNA-binding PadR family transcriptional regulator n=1 Tax=Pseudarthrobacter niigatensis TaxID=369935 RepID=A0AAJ1SPX1_9MICC|nr:PadR family transcriptional regulator [Pseudarthrobacter niigatensis]MDQ0144684.1 DNA-binding PadR family transcriptional regulator [Pseudarthrobacter niigatensis]MDQ0265330.1 DNA-binding PadR family transcriptional regulator [Pseudarthrobacter niigatensis]